MYKKIANKTAIFVYYDYEVICIYFNATWIFNLSFDP